MRNTYIKKFNLIGKELPNITQEEKESILPILESELLLLKNTVDKEEKSNDRMTVLERMIWEYKTEIKYINKTLKIKA